MREDYVEKAKNNKIVEISHLIVETRRDSTEKINNKDSIFNETLFGSKEDIDLFSIFQKLRL